MSEELKRGLEWQRMSNTKCRVCNESLEGHNYVACHSLAESLILEQAKRIAELEADNHRMLTAISEAMKGIGFCSTRGEDYAFECLRSARDNTKAPDALGEQQ